MRFPDPAKVPQPELRDLYKMVPVSTLARMDALAKDKSLLLQLCRDALALCCDLSSGRPVTAAERAERARIEEAVRAIQQ